MTYVATRFLSAGGVLALGLALHLAYCTPLFASEQSGDEAVLRSLTERFFAAHQKKDLDELISLWSEKSPELAATKQSFAAHEKIELKSVSIGKVVVEGERARVRLVVEISAVDGKT